MTTETTYKIETVYTLRAPLSHIGESESTETFLSTITIRNGATIEDVFAYSGNALRGAWRDAGAKYLLEKLGGIRVPKKVFHLLFTGGSISGDQVVDIGQAKLLRSSFPFISIFGGGVGNQILSGKITQTFAYPVCKETTTLIPVTNDAIDYSAQALSWRQLTNEVSFSRMDDEKDRLGDTYITEADLLIESEKKGKKESKEPATQMRYTAEYLIPGTQLWHQMEIRAQEVELGALVSAIHEWAKSPHLGGMAAKGFGLVDVHMNITRNEQVESFLSVASGNLQLSAYAADVKAKYDEQVLTVYNEYLESDESKFIKLLEG